MIGIRNEGPIRVVAIQRPQARNAVDPATATELFKAFLRFEADETASVAILTGDETAFCAGFDLKAVASGLKDGWTEQLAIPEDWDDPVARPLPSPMGPARLCLSKPVIAAIEGPAVAGGTELALWANIRIASDNAYFGIFCRRWGVPLNDGGTLRLPRIIGEGRAMDMILTGRGVTADEALAIGLVNQVVPAGQALSAARDYAQTLLRFPAACMRGDMASAALSPGALAEGLRREWRSANLIATDTNAAKFAAGKGRGGDFGDI